MENYTRAQIEAITRDGFAYEMRKYRALAVAPRVRIRTAPDSCEACQALAAQSYDLESVPELPHKGCTHVTGCRCAVTPADE